MGKFEEENCEKVDRLVEMWETYSARVARVEDTLEDDELELDEDDLLARKLEEGLFTLQQCAKVIGYLALAGGAVSWLAVSSWSIERQPRLIFSCLFCVVFAISPGV